MQAFLRRATILAYSATVLAGITILSWPRAPLAPIVSKSSWIVSGRWFENARPATSGAFPGLDGPEQRFFRSWSPQTDNTQGRIETAPFNAPAYLVVPALGYPTRSNSGIFLECLADGKMRRLLTGNPHENWVQTVFYIPSDWCTGESRIVAVNAATDGYIGVGTPCKATVWHWLLTSMPVVLVLHLVAFIGISGPILMVGMLIRDKGPPGPERFAWASLPLFVLSYVSFFIVFAFHRAGALSILFAVLAFAGWIWWLRRSPHMEYAKRREIAAGLGTLFCVSLFATAVLYMVDTGAGRWNAAYRFWPAIWSSDHLLPAIVAEAVADGWPLHGLLGPGWKVSDRPPLMSGLLVLIRPWFDAATWLSGATRLVREDGLKITSIVAQSFSVAAGVCLTRVVLRRELRNVEIAAWSAVVLSPFLLFNLTYTWPKLFAAGLVTLGFVPLIAAIRSEASSSIVPASVVGGALVGLGVLAHSGVALGLAAAPILVWTGRPSRAVGVLGVAGIACAITYAPWAWWVATFDPPGDALAKYALTGDFGLATPTLPLRDAIVAAYSHLTIDAWLHIKWLGFLTIIGQVTPPALTSAPSDFLGELRLRDFYFVAESTRFLGLAVLAAAVVSAFRNDLIGAERASFLRVLTTAILGILFTWLVTLSTVQINHHESYFSIMMLYMAAVIGLGMLDAKLGWTLMILQGLYSLIVWGISPAMVHRNADLWLVLVAILALAGFAKVNRHAFVENAREIRNAAR
jgi:hypothetical protein